MVQWKKLIIVITIVTAVILAVLMGFNLFRMINDKDPPNIVYVGYNSEVKVNSSTTIQIFAEDVSGIRSCRIFYRINGSGWSSEEMKRYVIICCPPRFVSRLGPLFPSGVQLEFYFDIVDKKDNRLITDVYTLDIITG